MCNACLPTPSNIENTDAFADDLLGMLNQGALALMVSINHRTGLFDAMAEDSGQTVIAGLDEHILPLVHGLQDRLEQGIRVLDIGCGKGRALLHLAARWPRGVPDSEPCGERNSP